MEQPVERGGFMLDIRKPIVEFIGLFMLTYFGSWAVVYSDFGLISANGVALAHALSLTLAIWFSFGIGGGHINPAVTFGLLVAKKIDWRLAIWYWIAQFMGAIFASAMIFFGLSAEQQAFLGEKSFVGVPAPGLEDLLVNRFCGEIIGTFILMWMVMSLAVDEAKGKLPAPYVAPAVGFTVYITILSFGIISGGGLNPARSLGPAFISDRIGKDQLAHLLGPFIGSALASLLYQAIYLKKGRVEPFYENVERKRESKSETGEQIELKEKLVEKEPVEANVPFTDERL